MTKCERIWQGIYGFIDGTRPEVKDCKTDKERFEAFCNYCESKNSKYLSREWRIAKIRKSTHVYLSARALEPLILRENKGVQREVIETLHKFTREEQEHLTCKHVENMIDLLYAGWSIDAIHKTAISVSKGKIQVQTELDHVTDHLKKVSSGGKGRATWTDEAKCPECNKLLRVIILGNRYKLKTVMLGRRQ